VKTPQEREIVNHVEDLCIKDHNEHIGKILLTTFVFGYTEVYFNPPARVRVLKMDHKHMLNWTCREFCDPRWDVELVESHPALGTTTGLWIYGISHSIDSKIQQPYSWTVDTSQEPQPSPKPSLEILENNIKLQPAYTHDTKVFCPHCCREIVVTTTMSIDTDETV